MIRRKISQATAYRYLDEAIEVLAAQAPDLTAALERVAADGWSHVVLDGKIVATDRLTSTKTSTMGKLIDTWYSGKTAGFGGNIQAVRRPDGFPIWVSDVEPGSEHDISCARRNALPALYAAASTLPTLADGGYHGAGIGVHTPIKQPTDGTELDPDTRTYNALLRALRCLGERGFASSPAAGDPPTHHPQPKQDRPNSKWGARPHPLRARLLTLLRKPQ